MTRVTVRQQNQLTIPVDIARAAGITEGSMCTMELINGTIIITPAGVVSPSLDSFAGVARGAWAASSADLERAQAADRSSWD